MKFCLWEINNHHNCPKLVLVFNVLRCPKHAVWIANSMCFCQTAPKMSTPIWSALYAHTYPKSLIFTIYALVTSKSVYLIMFCFRVFADFLRYVDQYNLVSLVYIFPKLDNVHSVKFIANFRTWTHEDTRCLITRMRSSQSTLVFQ